MFAYGRHLPERPGDGASERIPLPPGAAQDRIVRVIDGDTVIGASYGRIRYIGVDTPEVDAPDAAVREMAARATEANRSLVEGRTVWLVTDVQTHDRYGRLLAYVWDGRIFVNAWLVENGLATMLTIPPNVRYADLFARLQQQARERRRGLWAEP